jgi:hypothetical protein
MRKKIFCTGPTSQGRTKISCTSTTSPTNKEGLFKFVLFESPIHLSFNHRVHRVATAAFWRSFSHEDKISPWLVREGVHAHPLSLHLPSPVKLQCVSSLGKYVLCGFNSQQELPLYSLSTCSRETRDNINPFSPKGARV